MSPETQRPTADPLEASIAPAGMQKLQAEKRAWKRDAIENLTGSLMRGPPEDWREGEGRPRWAGSYLGNPCDRVKMVPHLAAHPHGELGSHKWRSVGRAVW